MNARAPVVLSVDALHPRPDAIAAAARVLADGGLVAFPAETVYGLGARALDRTAVARVFHAKGRPRAHPLILHLSSAQQARAYAATWSAEAQRLADTFWPGPLTLVVERAPSVPDEVTGGASSVALRVPAHPVARAILGARVSCRRPSANRYQTLSPRPPPTWRNAGRHVDGSPTAALVPEASSRRSSTCAARALASARAA